MFYYFGYKDIKFKELGMGVILVLLTIFMQPFFQNSIFYLVDVSSNADLLSRGLLFISFISVWIGFVAAGFQQIFRYPLARARPVKNAVFIGIGFGLGEAILIPFLGLFVSQTPTTAFSLNISFLTLFERFVVTLFHGSSTALMAYAYQRGWGTKALVGLIFAHGVMDSLAAYYQLNGSEIILAVELLLVTYISISVFVYTMRRVREDFNYKFLG